MKNRYIHTYILSMIFIIRKGTNEKALDIENDLLQ